MPQPIQPKRAPKSKVAPAAYPAETPASRRKAERSMLMLDPLLLDKEGRVIARIADISVDGVSMYSKGVPFAKGTRLSGWLDAPSLGNFDEEFVAVWLTVAWSRPEGPEGWFKAGCVFEIADQVERMRLERLISELRIIT